MLIYQHATISNTFFPSTLPRNVSFTLVEDWTSKNITILYEGVAQQKDWISNGAFTANDAGWGNFSEDPVELTINPWQSGGYVQIQIDTLDKTAKTSAYFEQNISIPDTFAEEKLASISLDYYYIKGGPTIPDNISLFFSVEINEQEINNTILFKDLVQDTWTKTSITYDPIVLGQSLPDNATVRMGVFVDDDTTVLAADHFIRFDNVEFKIWTKPISSNLVKAYDVEFSENYSYTPTTYGEGYSFIDVEHQRTGTSDVIFTISENVTGVEDLEIYNITITSEAVKIFNSTIDGQIGSTYIINNEIIWQTECSFSIPYGYLNNWAKINKPNDWNITSILDGYNTEKIGCCTGSKFGSTSLKIPQDCFGPGLWSIQANGRNYITKGSIVVWNGTFYNEEYCVSYGDKFRIDATLNNTISLTNTQINCTIEYPNGTIFKKIQKEPLLYDVDFGEFIVGNNMSVGTYQVSIIWANDQSYLSRNKIGFSQFSFNVWHHTNLTAINSYIERVSGEPLLIRVKYVDSDFNQNIDFATITYNSTFGTSGNMAYTGSGVYVIDVDSSGLGIGDYYFSFNASKSYYENQSIRNLIHLKIVNQPLALEVPHNIINAIANDYAICQINVTGAISGALLPGDTNITTDWMNPYSVTNISTGVYELNFSTYNLPTLGITEVYTVTIFANKTDYGSITGYISLQITPLAATVKVNVSQVNVVFNENFYLKVNYTETGTGEIISDAVLNVTWVSSYTITPVADGFIVFLSTSGLSIDIYTLIFQLSHPGYQTAFKSIFVSVTSKPNYIEIYLNQEDKSMEKSITIQSNEDLNVTIFFKDSKTNDFIPGATVALNGSGISRLLDESGQQYETNLSAGSLPIGIHFLTITIEKENHMFISEIISVIVNPITTMVGLNETIINVLLNRDFYIKVNYTIAATGEIISGATLNVTWPSSYTIFPVADGFIVHFSTSSLSVDFYSIFFQLSHPEYQTSFESIFVIIEENPTYIELYLNQADKTMQKSITILSDEDLNITIMYKDSLTNDFIPGATVALNGSGISRLLDESGQQYETNLSAGALSVGIHFLTITIEKEDFLFLSEIISVIVNPITTTVSLNETVVNVLLNHGFYIKVNFTIAATSEIITGATLNVTWLSSYTIFPVTDGFIVYFSTVGLSIDNYAIFFQLSHPEYQTAFESIYVIIEENPTYIEVYLNQEDKTTEKTITMQWNEILNITILYKDSLTHVFISGAIVNLNGSGISRILDENGQQYYTILSIGLLPIGIHFLTVSIEKENYVFLSEIIKIVVEQVELSMRTIGFEESLDVYAGSTQLVKINLSEQNSGDLITNANITFTWRYGFGEFENLGDGTYLIQLDIPSKASGSLRINLLISVEGGYYRNTESSFLIVVLQESGGDYSLVLIISIIALCIIGVLGALIARSYIYLPRKREKERQFLDKIQVFKDLENIQGIMLIQKNSGMPIYTKNVSEFNFEENILISGFIQAITIFGEQT
ncbi:MAG: hypothetical protein ACFFCV_17810, partial [Promethearchaeota archaeon]